MNLSKLKEFYYVAKSGSVSQAARELNMCQPSLSRSIMNFEASVGKKLFIRSIRGMQLTPTGEMLYGVASRIIEELEMVSKFFLNSRYKPEGEVSVALGAYFVPVWVVQALQAYMLKYPEVSLTLLENVEHVDFTKADVFIGSFSILPRDAICHTLMSSKMGLYTSARYLDRKGPIARVQDLANHDLITFNDKMKLPYDQKRPWLTTLGPFKPSLKVSSSAKLMDMIDEGLGVAEMPQSFGDPYHHNFVPVLPDLIGPEIRIDLLYCEQLKKAPVITSLREFIVNLLANQA